MKEVVSGKPQKLHSIEQLSCPREAASELLFLSPQENPKGFQKDKCASMWV